MDEYLCLTVLSRPSEPDAEFKARLSAFWTTMLRTRPDDFEKVDFPFGFDGDVPEVGFVREFGFVFHCASSC